MSETSVGIESLSSFTLSFFFLTHLNDCDRLDRQTQATTFIHQVFGGYLRSRGKFLVICLTYITILIIYCLIANKLIFFVCLVKCLNCKAVSDTFDPFLDIPLEIKVIVFRSLNLWLFYSLNSPAEYHLGMRKWFHKWSLWCSKSINSHI